MNINRKRSETEKTYVVDTDVPRSSPVNQSRAVGSRIPQDVSRLDISMQDPVVVPREAQQINNCGLRALKDIHIGPDLSDDQYKFLPDQCFTSRTVGLPHHHWRQLCREERRPRKICLARDSTEYDEVVSVVAAFS